MKSLRSKQYYLNCIEFPIQMAHDMMLNLRIIHAKNMDKLTYKQAKELVPVAIKLKEDIETVFNHIHYEVNTAVGNHYNKVKRNRKNKRSK